MKTYNKIAIASTFLWIGFTCAISFIEAWLKFRAPGVTMPIGLGIGRLVFGALNKMEWLFAVVIVGSFIFSKAALLSKRNRLLFVALILLLVETAWALPALDARAELYIQGMTVPTSYLHFYFVGMEIIKVACLTIFGFKLFNKL